MKTRELLKKVRKIEIRTKGLTSQIFAGEYHSAFKGRGMSFSEVRAYQYGDDVRNIDWNVTARTGDAYIKEFEEERELTVMLLVDISKSTSFGTVEEFKSDLITEITAVLSFSAISNNDKVGVILFSDKMEKYIPPQKGKKHILKIIRELLSFEPTGEGTDLKVALEFMSNVMKKRATVFVLSDFLTKDGYDQALSIASKRHNVIGMMLSDPIESELPNVGLLRLRDAESGEVRIIDTSLKSTRDKVRDYYKGRIDSVDKLFKRKGADMVHIYTNESYIIALKKFFKSNSRR